jgi:acetyl esterase/lipase
VGRSRSWYCWYFVTILLVLLVSASSSLAVSTTIQYGIGSQGQPLLLDAYPAAGRSVIVVHGGQWTGGARDETRVVQLCNALQARGVACFSIDYELAPASQWPTQLQNMRDALSWVQANANPDVSVWGQSSGAHLALMLAFDTPGVRSVIGWSSPTDFTTGTWGGQHAKKLLGCYPWNCPALAAEASPIHQAHSASPPILLAHSLLDGTVPYSQSSSLDVRLTELGVSHRLDTYPGTKHAGALFAQAFEPSYLWLMKN